ncbi:Uncharacterised protein family (UPF0223) [Streptococcus pneumoniae]|nr:Uncharacterised protein family (UPF0223) [Streptococcus pneumoniae]
MVKNVLTCFLNKLFSKFKAVVPSKSEEKRLGREFETVSGYSLYRAVQAAKEKGEGKISLGK